MTKMMPALLIKQNNNWCKKIHMADEKQKHHFTIVQLGVTTMTTSNEQKLSGAENLR